MRTKPFGNNIQPACKYCAHIEQKRGKYICDRKRSEVSGEHRCIWYKYNPLERIPDITPELPKYDAKNFKVD